MRFKNREMRVRIVKNDEPPKNQETPMKDNRVPAYTEAAKKIVITGALVVYGYVVVDTYRQTRIVKTHHKYRDR